MDFITKEEVMYMKREEIERQELYTDILLDANYKLKEYKRFIMRSCCPYCKNIGNNCLFLEHKLEKSLEIYKCKNYIRCEVHDNG